MYNDDKYDDYGLKQQTGNEVDRLGPGPIRGTIPNCFLRDSQKPVMKILVLKADFQPGFQIKTSRI